MTKITNAIRKLEKAGASVAVRDGKYAAPFPEHGKTVFFYVNGPDVVNLENPIGEVTCLHVMSERDIETTDSQTDYFPGSWDVRSIADAIRIATHADYKSAGCSGCYPPHECIRDTYALPSGEVRTIDTCAICHDRVKEATS